ncbi:MADS-box transcription factor 31-like [Miscanthus floridulus]|uniref:MADS-box transcription factor 31-like n=1 Tax=Miscanthus floridulus TaxID=154761 RepID=UPI00345754A7
MARKKVNLQWITKASSRPATYKRRCNGMKKKVDELVMLYGAKVGVVLYGENQVKPLSWPNDLLVKDILQKFINMPNFVKRFKKTQIQEELLGSCIPKLQRQVSRMENEHYKREIIFLLYEIMDGRRPGLIGTTNKERTSHGEMVERTKKVEELIQQLQLGIRQGKRVALDPPLPLQLASSSTQPSLAPYTFNEIQMSLVMVMGCEPPPQSNWIANLTTNGGELGFVGSSSRNDMMQPYNNDYFSTFPWTWEMDPCLLIMME